MQDRAMRNPKIAWQWNSAVREIHGTKAGGVTHVTLESTLADQRSEFPCGGVFVAIGHKPNTELFAQKLEMDAQGYLITQPGSTRTNVPGVFASGDVSDKVYRQAVTAAGTGCMAAIDAQRFLEH
jgi:thioredoxin reductase (NADPH)